MAKGINFNTQITRRQPIRTAPSKFLTSEIRGHIERSEGQRIAEAFYPYKCLPVMFIDTELTDGVVIPKGTIVSLLTNQTYSTTTPSGIANQSSSGVIPIFDDATTVSTTLITANIDDSYFGYHDAVAGLLVPCNGGVINRIPYSADDATVGAFTCSGLAVTTSMGADPASNYCTLEANMPVGIAMYDVYQDIRGKYLNYQIWDTVGILCDWYVEVPYVDISMETAFVSGYIDAQNEHAFNLSSSTCAGYLATWKKYAFFYFDGTATYNDGQAGMTVKSDLNGKFIPQGTGASAQNTTTTTQTVGKLVLTDARFPKDAMELVDTYPGSGMPGTETGGLPKGLFDFVKASKAAVEGTTPSIEDIVGAVRSGAYGMAHIQLML